ncbi:ATP-binding cassette domain-containing protein [Umezawaea endophytica]|uniref:ATP-binding cassette domain-containing protein n=1 Tax=Umezawaea endophytica TaxID=1654476 RepID=A0A9X3AEM4_9PSEU|nr:ATP-binding cassette domain-containing protein [Umezawaea endophytica]MCS7477467.1 ATP-binding cassette domain-containing protein [Umezawaea endophytica]
MSALEARDLVKEFGVRDGVRRSVLRAVDRVSFTLSAGRTVALVGESGSGKSTIARMIARLEKPTSGEIVLGGEALEGEALGGKVLGGKALGGKALSDREYRHRVQMVFQDPFASLNPFHTVEHHLARPLKLHGRVKGGAESSKMVRELLERVTLPAEFASRRPHELSGGQRQRVAIARALAPGAGIVVADEPVSMLDVSIRLGILKLLARLQREENLAVLYITHDLATARHFSDEILVLYRGRVVERGPADQVILEPRHPYTKLLAAASPDPSARGREFSVGREVVEAAGSAAAYDHFAGTWAAV